MDQLLQVCDALAFELVDLAGNHHALFREHAVDFAAVELDCLVGGGNLFRGTRQREVADQLLEKFLAAHDFAIRLCLKDGLDQKGHAQLDLGPAREAFGVVGEIFDFAVDRGVGFNRGQVLDSAQACILLVLGIFEWLGARGPLQLR